MLILYRMPELELPIFKACHEMKVFRNLQVAITAHYGALRATAPNHVTYSTLIVTNQ